MYYCKICDRNFEKQRSYIGHCRIHYLNKTSDEKKEIKLSKQLDKQYKKRSCIFCDRIFEYEDRFKLAGHVAGCHLNPNKDKYCLEQSKRRTGYKYPQEFKDKVSEGMKLAHKEKRAWNIGKSRWNNKQSYPEIFFSKVIENEFEDKNVTVEYPIGIYSLDFAWIEKKKCIEIDGEQHQRFEEYRERDIRKDKFLQENGWKVLRIEWKDMYKNTKLKIKEASDFIHD